MKDIYAKLKILTFTLIPNVIKEWKTEIWDKNLDQPYCCDGESGVYPCGCQGMTVRELYDK